MFKKIKIDSTFDLEKTLECGQCFHYKKYKRGYLVFGLNSLCYIIQDKGVLYIETEDFSFWENYFTLDVDYIKICKELYDFAKKNNDSFALKSIDYGKGIRILRQPYFETCCSYIISQRNNIPRIRKIVFDMSERFSSKKVKYEGVVYKLFPSVEDLRSVSLEQLKSVGLGYRAKYIYDFVRNWNNVIDSIKFKYEYDKDLLKKNLGIGEKVANCICLFCLEEYDAFPIDVWVQRIIDEEYIEKGKDLILPKQNAGILQQFMFYTKRNIIE